MPLLSHLSVREVYWDEDGDELTGWEPLRLKFLGVGSRESLLFPWLLHGHLAGGVESLMIEPVPLESVPLVGDLLRCAGASLNRLYIGLAAGAVLIESGTFFILDNNNNIRHLEFTACDESPRVRHSGSHSWIHIILSQVKSEIQTISMTFYFLKPGDNVAWINWNTVNAILATAFFKKLESFEIVVDHRCGIEGDEACNTFKSLLPTLTRRPGILRLVHRRTGDGPSETTYL
ncbi:hypothetical protein JAAARDRAFT_195291 [Jaapia argillacea MUCL 33604]|uniref:Uncharacterized protein n=1 Tax=Jaapia argillacea MUCL 33604 TaxID=933084 RepID=A0A067PQI0_9AGAM|nr:hypothetical protein JAAARDRAFT_195291 [Jaapia argillacea MUCL 33604]